MKLAEIAKKSDHELKELIVSSRAEMAKAIIDSRTKEIRDVKVQGRIKKTIARAITIIRERELTKQEEAV